MKLENTTFFVFVAFTVGCEGTGESITKAEQGRGRSCG